MSSRQPQKLQQSLESGGGAGRLEWSWGGKRLGGEERLQLGEQQGSKATGLGAGLKVILWILTKFDYTIIKIHMKMCSFLWSAC